LTQALEANSDEIVLRSPPGYCEAMSQHNVDVIRETFEAYNRGDYSGASAWLAPDVVWEVGQELPAHGPAAVRRMWERWDSDWEELETVPEEFIDTGDNVFVAVHYRARGKSSGVEVDDRLFDVYTLRHGKCVRKREFRDRSEALEAAGLRE
jgi:ketosteroid isomerase-like protein